jgi:hypothetical protein
MKLILKSLSGPILWVNAFVLLASGFLASAQTPWPHPIPCRIHDGTNPDLFVVTLGDVETPIADGVFDPVRDTVTLKDGGIKTNYYRDTLGVRFYRPLDKSRFPLPPSGMCTWYYYYNRINETEVRRNAEWIAANLKDYGAEYVQIDDGWQGSGDREGGRDWTKVNPERFPNGMQKLAARIKALGLKPGIWLAPHGQSNPQVVSNHAGVFLLRTNGATASDTWEGRFLVDPTNPDSHEYLRELFTKLRGWGYEYFKIDGQPIVVNEYDTKAQFMKASPGMSNGPALYRKTLETLREAIGPRSYLLGCWGIPLEGAGIMNGSRTGGDIVLGWGGFQVALRPTLQYYYLHNIVWYCDPDVMLVRSPLTLDQARVWATLQGLTGQALMSSDRLMDLGEERVEFLRRVYPATDIRPLDLFPTERYKRIWDLKINHGGRKYDVVGVFNFSEGRAERTLLKWKDLGLSGDRKIQVFDFWNREYLGAWREGMQIEVAPTSCHVLTLLPEDGNIQLISTSRHITQGWMDLVDVQPDETGHVFKGKSKVVKDDPYQLSFAFPPGTNYAIKRFVARAGHGVLPVKIINHQGWAAAQLTSAKTTEVTWEVGFEPADFYHFPASPPEGVAIQRLGLDGTTVTWREQYYLNCGYQVYLNGALQGYTASATFDLRGLDTRTNYTVQVKAVWEDGRESPRAGEARFTLASLVPEKISLTQVEPRRSTGRWRGFEIEDLLPGGRPSVGGLSFNRALTAFPNSEVEFDVHGLYRRFTAQMGVEAGFSTNTTARFIVLGDGKELWRSEFVKPANGATNADVDISGVEKLVLRTATAEQAGGRRGRSRIVWGEPTISKEPETQLQMP